MKIAIIIGPYTGSTTHEIKTHIHRAERVAEKYWLQGYAVICPHTNSSYMSGLIPEMDFLTGYHEILKRCDTVIVMSDWKSSSGARKEHRLATSLGKEIIMDQGGQ